MDGRRRRVGHPTRPRRGDPAGGGRPVARRRGRPPRREPPRTVSAGLRPPCHSATTTASGPSKPCTRFTARTARSAAAVSLPQNPSRRPVAATTSSGMSQMRAMPAVGSVARRARRAVEPAVELPAEPVGDGTGGEAAPVPAPSTATAARALAVLGLGTDEDAGARRARGGRDGGGGPPPAPRTTNAAGLDALGGRIELGGDARGPQAGASVAGGRSSRPQATRCAAEPSLPKRASTSAAGSAANIPSVVSPRRRRTSTSSGRSSVATGNGARNPGLAPRATTCAGRAVATPSRRELGGERTVGHAHRARPHDRASAPATSAWVRAASDVVTTEVARRSSSRERHRPGRLSSMRGVSASSEATTGSKARASRAGS